ncbi:MAG: GIY-YIG nuclease family protein [Ekhidna sp.]|nr:GIY-YIG nuclease family protein [Ekhidna sp.]
MKNHNYFTYITTNRTRKVLYTGMTNDLFTRMSQHKADALGEKKTFAGKYNCYHLVYWERHQFVNDAIEREKEIKGWKRFKKIKLVEKFNPEWKFLNDELD